MNYARNLIVGPGHKVRLKDIDPGFHGTHESADKAAPEIAANLEKLRSLQYTLYAERAHSLLIVLQGIDAAGKDGVCRHVITAMSPQGCIVTGFKQPTVEERGHDFLWRVHRHSPELGQVAIFNRSHYEDVLVVRVHKLAPKETWSLRYDHINAFEKLRRRGAIDYPLNIGGKPLLSIPAFIPVTFELTVLFSVFATFFGLWALCGLPQLFHPAFSNKAFAKVTDDKFFILVEADDPKFDLSKTKTLLEQTGATFVEEVED